MRIPTFLGLFFPHVFNEYIIAFLVREMHAHLTRKHVSDIYHLSYQITQRKTMTSDIKKWDHPKSFEARNQHGCVQQRHKVWDKNSNVYTNLRPNRISAREDLGNTFYNLATDIPLFISFKDPSNQNKWKFVLSICQIKDELSGIQTMLSSCVVSS